MANTESGHMVLRTVYIPKEVDDQLRQVAFHREVSKNTIIREGIRLVLAQADVERHVVTNQVTAYAQAHVAEEEQNEELESASTAATGQEEPEYRMVAAPKGTPNW